MIEFILFAIGIIILIKGADFLVEGASSLAIRFRIAPIVIGLTVVALGTSAPELVVSLTSAIRGNTDIALGNIVGSNILNILLVLGISAVIYPLTVAKNTTWKEIPFSFLAAILLVILGMQIPINTGSFDYLTTTSRELAGVINRSGGLVLLSFFILFLYYTFGITKVTGNSVIIIKKLTLPNIMLLIALGLFGLTIGSNIAVNNAISIARLLNVSETLIGFTLVAVGTSLPELVTNISAARKKKSDIVLGNIVGSNIFNIFFVLGLTSLVKDIPIKAMQTVDIVILLMATLLLFISVFVWKRHTIGRKEGTIMILCYIAYTAFLFIRG